ncbi:hypothetical protein ACSBR2_017573 [Camellia fascicularis]
MAFTITMMSWSIVEYGRQMAASRELSHAMEAVKWGTDYLIKAHPHRYVLYGEMWKKYLSSTGAPDSHPCSSRLLYSCPLCNYKGS